MIAGSSATTAAAVSSGLAAGVGKTPMKVPDAPLKVTIASGSSEASSTRATSRSRTTSLSSRAQRQRPERLGRLQRRIERDAKATNSFSVLPGADRKFALPIASATSAAVTPREASFSGSIQTRMA